LETKAARPSSAGHAISMSAPKLRILLVEDHAATANAVRKYLEVTGYAVHVAPDVRCAREYADENEFDVLLSDIKLPDGTGWDLMRRLRRGRHVAGVAISGYGSETDIERSRAAGFGIHLVKPLSPDELTAALEVVAAGRPPAARGQRASRSADSTTR
jgi:DNA-binding response OmpR family regulator